MDNSLTDKEKIKSIIDNLQSQFEQNASNEKLIESAHLLIRELQQNHTHYSSEKRNISVVMPGSSFAAVNAVKEQITIHKTEDQKTEENPEPIDLKEVLPQLPKEQVETILQIDIDVDNHQKPKDVVAEKINDWNIFGTFAEAPTIALYKSREPEKEINEKFSAQSNDLSQSLQNIPIRDLTTAVGINDRYLFINELFRGDEFMYERSIITLNKFNSYDQAHSWIERELRLKMGWDVENKITQQFEQLIKRRFN
ncbi:MAG: hypothetical protein PW786_14330 [Arachidicoccus sp.]|nr:hypothetical protein [Arachidicoccus sp.]